MAIGRKNISKREILFQRINNLIHNDTFIRIVGIILIFSAVILFMSIVSFFINGADDQSLITAANKGGAITKDSTSNIAGFSGASMAYILVNKWIGIASILLPIFLGICGVALVAKKSIRFIRIVSYTSALMILISLTLSLFFVEQESSNFIFLGGLHGYYITEFLEIYLGWSGTLVLLVTLYAILTVIAIKNIDSIIKSIFSKILSLGGKKGDEDDMLDAPSPVNVYENPNIDFKPKSTESEYDVCILPKQGEKPARKPIVEEVVKPIREEIVSPTQRANKEEDITPESDVEFDIEVGIEDDIDNSKRSEIEDYDPCLDLSRYKPPTFNLLNAYEGVDVTINEEEQRANKQRIVETLENYDIRISSIKANVGPTITLYEIVPEVGIRIAKIRNLEDDIALSLAALGIRIIAPIPGRGTIGIEVPNKDPKIVSMYSVIASRKLQESNYDLPIALGKTISNDVFMLDLAKMPHVLVAGATGQGKSVGLNAIITSLLYKKHPAQLKFVLIDPKKVEFNIYSEIEKNFLAKLPDHEDAIVTDINKVKQTLKSVTQEMDNRYLLLQKAKARNIKEYNAKFTARKLSPENGHYYMPYIVVIVDEFGDLIMTAGKEVELPIARIAQLARAVGIHMIIATQRPSTNIITGIIKANFPARIAFKVSSMIDSRTILDCPGANQLIGRGDMLFSQGSDLVRVQCAFIDTPEVERVCSYINQQQSYPTAYELPDAEEGGESSMGGVNLKERDELFEEAARMVVAEQQGSTSMIQRKFSLGYNRSGRIMDQLEAAGVVGASEGSKPRKVLIMDLIQLDNLLDTLKSI